MTIGVKRLPLKPPTIDINARAADIEKVGRVLHEKIPVITVVWYQHTASIASDLLVIDPLQRSYNLSRLSWAH